MAEPPAWLEDVRRTGNVDALLSVIPYARMLGLSAHVRDGDLLIRMAGSDHLVGNPVLPALHGGTVGALLESTAIFKVMREADTERVPKIITLTVDFLRSAKVTETWARASITRLGRRVANVQARAWQDSEERPIAVAHAHFLLQSREG